MNLPIGSAPYSVHRSFPPIHIRALGMVDYEPTLRKMQHFTATRTPATEDEIWLVQHPPTYTLGQAGKAEHLLHPSSIPVIRTDRGGQITYHGPGQIVAYLLLDLRHWKLNVGELVRLMEQAVIDLLAEHGVHAERREGAPGVYVRGAKIAALGLKIRNGCCYHGLSLNVDMDLAPFANIHPCGYRNLNTTQCLAEGITVPFEELQAALTRNLVHSLRQHLDKKRLEDLQ